MSNDLYNHAEKRHLLYQIIDTLIRNYLANHPEQAQKTLPYLPQMQALRDEAHLVLFNQPTDFRNALNQLIRYVRLQQSITLHELGKNSSKDVPANHVYFQSLIQLTLELKKLELDYFKEQYTQLKQLFDQLIHNPSKPEQFRQELLDLQGKIEKLFCDYKLAHNSAKLKHQNFLLKVNDLHDEVRNALQKTNAAIHEPLHQQHGNTLFSHPCKAVETDTRKQTQEAAEKTPKTNESEMNSNFEQVRK